MFTIHRTYNSLTLPVAVLYVDSLNTAYSFTNITIEAGSSDDTLALQGATNTTTFAGAAFPLSGGSYTTAVTGTMTITVTQQLSTGLHALHFVSSLALPGLAGIGLSGMIGLGTRTQSSVTLPTLVQVQVFSLPTAVAGAYNVTTRTPIADMT